MPLNNCDLEQMTEFDFPRLEFLRFGSGHFILEKVKLDNGAVKILSKKDFPQLYSLNLSNLQYIKAIIISAMKGYSL